MSKKPEDIQLDKRNYEEIAAKAVELAQSYFPQTQWKWKSIYDPLDKDDPAYRMLEIFARLMEILIRRFNKIPDKNFLSFLDMVGVEQKAGNPAEVPVTFLPAQTAVTGGEVPAGTQVATTQTDTEDAFVFETRDAFYATPAKLIKAVYFDPPEDKYGQLILKELPPKPEELSNEKSIITVFKKENNELQEIEHILYIASKSLFTVEEPVTLKITFENNSPQIFNNKTLQWKLYNEKNGWLEIKNISYEYYDKEVTITINNFTGSDTVIVNGIEAHWLACHFTGKFGSAMEIPRVTAISGKILPPGDAETLTTKIVSTFSNSTPVDPSKPIYPFGQRPQYGDAFYIGSKKAFAPEVQSVTLAFTICPYKNDKLKEIFKNIQKDISLETEIAWEYLDNSGEWQLLYTFTHILEVQKAGLNVNHIYKRDEIKIEGQDGTFFGIAPNTPSSALVVLDIPQNIGLNELNKQENYWLRARLKTFDPYGKEAWIESTGNGNQPFTVIGPTLIPPIIENISAEYTYKSDFIPVEAIQTKNNFEFKIIQEKPASSFTAFLPFEPITTVKVEGLDFFSSEPALYLGFDKEFGDVYISMFIHLTEDFSTDVYALEQENPRITWEYRAMNNNWRPLDINDNTDGLTTSGTIAFLGPTDSIKSQAGIYWYRVRLSQGFYTYPPVIKGIYLNTVMAQNREVNRQDQVIGSGNGTANQQLTLVRIPITGGQLWIREAEKPNEVELKNHLQEFRKFDQATDIKEEDIFEEKETPAAGSEENWVQWLKVPNFLVSGPRSRHYTLDAVNGIVTFGDGKNGLIPLIGKDNIIISDYCTGGGEKANSIAVPLAVNVLKSSLPYIDKVFNAGQAMGGSDPWTLEQTREFGPQSIKHRDRAVSNEDYEWMILQQFSQVARVKCISTQAPDYNSVDKLKFKPGAVTMIVVPKTNAPQPQPSKGLLKNIKDYLQTKALGTIVNDIYVIGPKFEIITITAKVVPHNPNESFIVESRIVKALEDFFHPLTGGEHGEGWAFGRDVYISEIYAVIARTPGVEYVKQAGFDGNPGKDYLEIGNNSLVCSGVHKINMEGMD